MAEGKQQPGSTPDPSQQKSPKQSQEKSPQHSPQKSRPTGSASLITLVCITCGNEKFFDGAVPRSLQCDKCGSTVFREFATPTEPDEATLSQLEEQARSIQYGDSSPQTSPDEVRDLDMR